MKADLLWDRQKAAEGALEQAQEQWANYPGPQSDQAVRRAQSDLDAIKRERRWTLAHDGQLRGKESV